MRSNYSLMWLHWSGIICISAQGNGPSSMLIKFVIKIAKWVEHICINMLCRYCTMKKETLHEHKFSNLNVTFMIK